MGALKQGCGMARHLQARARKPPVRMDLKDPQQIDRFTRIPTHMGSGCNESQVLT